MMGGSVGKFSEHPEVQREAVSRFWRRHAHGAPVYQLCETSDGLGGSVAAEIEGRFLIFEAWGDLTVPLVDQTIQALTHACMRFKGRERPALFMDMSRVNEIDEGARSRIVEFRAQLEGPNGLARAAVVFADTLPRIMYDMAGVLRPAPWEEHVFPTVEEALLWLGQPKDTGLLHVDGVAWVVSMAESRG